jgi:hypothetical protein
MSVIFSQSAFVFGGSAANAGAATPNKKLVMMAVVKIFDMVLLLGPLGL